MNTKINSSKLCIIGKNAVGGYTCKWMDATGHWAHNWFSCRSLAATEAEAVRLGFTQASNSAIPGRRGIRSLVAVQS